MKGWLMLVALVATGCTHKPEFDATAMTKAVVSKSLKDPDSARWGEIKVVRFHEGYIACGTVNAKNSFGGYSGDAQFRAGFTPDGKGSADISENPGLGLMQKAQCDIIFDIASRHSAPSKWPGEKRELMTRAEASARKLAPVAVKLMNP
jgi:hypothetical protein